MDTSRIKELAWGNIGRGGNYGGGKSGPLYLAKVGDIEVRVLQYTARVGQVGRWYTVGILKGKTMDERIRTLCSMEEGGVGEGFRSSEEAVEWVEGRYMEWVGQFLEAASETAGACQSG